MRLQQQVLVLKGKGRTTGDAALIDSKGLFVAHRETVNGPTMTGIGSDGRSYRLTRLAVDDPSGLVLLSAQGWNRPGVPSVTCADQAPKNGARLLAVSPSGVFSAEMVRSDRFGVFASSRRISQLIEVKFESAPSQVAGALLFSKDGQFLGALHATLDAKEQSPSQNSVMDAAAPALDQNKQEARSPKPAMKVASPLAQSAGLGLAATQVGPERLTVAYAVGTSSLRNILDGFRSPTHEVWRPVLGVMVKDAPEGGAWIETVLPDSPAERFGLRAGDVIFQIGPMAIRNQIDFAKAMLQQKAGAQLQVAYLRSGQTEVVRLRLDKSRD